jgi:hypothetical protein
MRAYEMFRYFSPWIKSLRATWRIAASRTTVAVMGRKFRFGSRGVADANR